MSKNFENERTNKAHNHVLRAISLGNEGIFLPIFFIFLYFYYYFIKTFHFKHYRTDMKLVSNRRKIE